MIAGAGPAGMTAALLLSRWRVRSVVLGRMEDLLHAGVCADPLIEVRFGARVTGRAELPDGVRVAVAAGVRRACGGAAA